MINRVRKVHQDRDGGFTLIELLIVIVVLGVLAAIVVFAVGNETAQSKTSACQSQYKTIETGLEAYKANNGNYPATYALMDSDGELKTADFTSTAANAATDKNGTVFTFDTGSGAITLTGTVPAGCP